MTQSIPFPERTLLSKSERKVLQTFRRFLMTPGRMLCFHGGNLHKYKDALQKLSDKGLLVKESFRGGYSLTRAGYAVMRGRA